MYIESDLFLKVKPTRTKQCKKNNVIKMCAAMLISEHQLCRSK